MREEIFHDDVEFTGVRQGKACLHQHLLHFRQGKFQGNGKSQNRGLGRPVVFIRTDLREELAVDVRLFIALGIRHPGFIDFPEKHFRKTLIDLAQGVFKRCGRFFSWGFSHCCLIPDEKILQITLQFCSQIVFINVILDIFIELQTDHAFPFSVHILPADYSFFSSSTRLTSGIPLKTQGTISASR
jgi:hypothetical protein